MKIIFLDIDGVLNVIPQGFDIYGSIFHQHFIDNLHKIISETGAKIVLSSSWRFNGIESIREMWNYRKLPGEIVDITPFDIIEKDDHLSFIENAERGHEIQRWIDENKVDKYVILDDDIDMLSSQMNNFVRTSGNKHHYDCIDIGYGLTDICTDKAIKILNSI